MHIGQNTTKYNIFYDIKKPIKRGSLDRVY